MFKQNKAKNSRSVKKQIASLDYVKDDVRALRGIERLIKKDAVSFVRAFQHHIGKRVSPRAVLSWLFDLIERREKFNFENLARVQSEKTAQTLRYISTEHTISSVLKPEKSISLVENRSPLSADNLIAERLTISRDEAHEFWKQVKALIVGKSISKKKLLKYLSQFPKGKPISPKDVVDRVLENRRLRILGKNKSISNARRPSRKLPQAKVRRKKQKKRSSPPIQIIYTPMGGQPGYCKRNPNG